MTPIKIKSDIKYELLYKLKLKALINKGFCYKCTIILIFILIFIFLNYFSLFLISIKISNNNKNLNQITKKEWSALLVSKKIAI